MLYYRSNPVSGAHADNTGADSASFLDKEVFLQ